MGLVLLVVLGALVVGWFRGGSVAALSRVLLRVRWLVAVAVLAQVAGGIAAALGSGAGYEAGLVVSAIAALFFCARNLRVAGLALIGLGLALNALVVGLNGAMPVSFVQAYRAGADIRSIRADSDPRHVLLGDTTRLSWLGDVVPVPLPFRSEVDSPGDVLIAAGLGEFVVVGMGKRRSRHRGARRRHAATRRAPSASASAPASGG